MVLLFGGVSLWQARGAQLHRPLIAACAIGTLQFFIVCAALLDQRTAADDGHLSG